MFMFYNHLILPGTKINTLDYETDISFYNHLILPGTKIIQVNEVQGT